MSKVLIIGLDAATFDLIKPWAAEGKLPTMATLLERGVHGPLISVPNLNSIPAWTSFATGVNPGQHGVYWFYERKPGSYDYRFLNGGDIRVPRFWEILSQTGKKVGIVNVPMTYPARPTNGFLVAGLDAPDEGSPAFTYPPDLYRELTEAVGDYQIDTNILGYARSGRLDLAIKATHEVIEKRARAVDYLMDNYPWDLFVVVFTALDRIQHTFWRHMDPTHPDHDPVEARKYGDTIYAFYRRLDEVVGHMLAKVGEDTTVILVSDHGAGFDQRGHGYLNSWLESLGLLYPLGSDMAGFRKWGNRLSKRLVRQGAALADGLLSKRARRKLIGWLPGGRAGLVQQLHRPRCDWARTKVYAEYIQPGLRINLKGREPQGIVAPGGEYEALRDYLIEKLSSCEDVKTGKKVARRVCRREEVYHGQHVDKAPDLLIEWNYDMVVSGLCYWNESNRRVVVENKSDLVERRNLSGDHRPQGIFLIAGTHIRAGQELREANIMDIAPTVLYTMGQPVPKYMDGKVLVEAFSENFLADHPVTYGEEAAVASEQGEHDFTAREAQMVEERLRGLGYLD